MSTTLAALTTVAAIALTYLLCVRPVRHGHRGCAMTGRNARQHDSPTAQAQIAALRDELRLLQARETPPPGGWTRPVD